MASLSLIIKQIRRRQRYANLLSFEKLHDIRKDVTLNLPEGWELAMGPQYNHMPWYYMNAEAVMTADLHSFKLAILLLITLANDQSELYRMLAFPMRMLNVRYHLGK
jgi:hypothetical protein